ncbi:MAG: cytochrome c peroxidase [Bacteroidota bacterium]
MNKRWIGLVALLLVLGACQKEDDDNTGGGSGGGGGVTPNVGDLIDIPFDPTAYDLVIPDGFPMMEIPEDNPMVVEAVELGRHLFFDPLLSVNLSMSCSSCHLPNAGFTDGQPVSVGVDGIAGTRSSMSLFNVGFFNKGLLWDGRVATLEEQAGIPVEDPIELHDTWPNVEEKLRQHDQYPRMFREAFGIEDRSDISKDLAVKALAQFQRTLILGSNSKYDRVLRREEFFSNDEQNGFDMFFDIVPSLPDAECGHCHNAPLFTTNEYFNNGIDSVGSLEEFDDKGLGAFSGRLVDNGKFRTPSLRNIALTAPYMHDGRFQTLEEVVDHYNSGGHLADNLHPLIVPLGLTEEQKKQVIAFLHTLTDTSYLENPAFQSPFK